MKIQKILIVDDEKLICDLFKSLFEDEGLEVCTAHNGCEAYSFLKENQVDFILSDIQMPVKDGVGLKNELNNSGNTTPFLFMTGFAHLSIQEAKKMGALGIIKKPFDIEEFKAFINFKSTSKY